MADLKVDYDTLHKSSSTLVGLKREFDNIESRVGDVDFLADGGIKDAMHEFGTNWSYHREKLSEKIESTGKKVDACLEAFKKTDTKLYDALTKKGKGGGK